MNSELKHILCVDDDQDILEVVKMCLEIVGGFTVSCLPSGEQAVSQAEQLRPDMILLDVMMPDMDGPTVLDRLRRLPGLQRTPVVFMTARVQSAEVEEYLNHGAVGVIPKPFDPMSLPAQIADFWEEYCAG